MIFFCLRTMPRSMHHVHVHVPKGFYSSEFYTDKIMEHIDSRDAGKPFFAYLSFTAPHDPLHVSDEWLDKYKGRYDKGYEALRKERLSSWKKLGFIPEDTVPFLRLSNITDWEDLPKEQSLCLGCEFTHSHIFDHALTQQTSGLS